VQQLEKLTNTKESENTFLRNQVERLQSEVAKYHDQKGSSPRASPGDGGVSSLSNSPFTFDYPLVQRNNTTSSSSSLQQPLSSVPSLSAADSPSSVSSGLSHNSPFSGNEQPFALPDSKKKKPAAAATGGPQIFDASSPESVLFHDYREPLFGDVLADDGYLVNPLADDDSSPYINTNKIWEKIASHPDFEQIDIDGLCGELRSKAKCSESGVVIHESELDRALNSLQGKQKKAAASPAAAA